MQSRFIFLGATMAFIAVAMGAFGAHAIKSVLSEQMLTVYKTAVTYQMWHALGLIGIGLFVEIKGPIKHLIWSAWLMFAGIILFSGSLYLLTLLNLKWLGMVTPFGGLALLSAWFLLALSAWRYSAHN